MADAEDPDAFKDGEEEAITEPVKVPTFLVFGIDYRRFFLSRFCLGFIGLCNDLFTVNGLFEHR